MSKKKKERFLVQVPITRAVGFQVFNVVATSAEEALRIAPTHRGGIQDQCVEVVEWDWAKAEVRSS